MADRNYEGIAAGLGVISSRIEEGRKRREEAYKSDREFQQRLQAAGIAAGRLEPVIQGGRITGVQSTTPFDASTLAPGQTYSQRVGGGTLTSRVAPAPRPPRETDPLVQLKREIDAQNALQAIEQRNALAPTLAMSEREKAFPRPAWGGIAGPGYVENNPNWLQSMTGVQKRPQAPAVAYTDTEPYRNRLTQLQSGRAALAPTTTPIAAPGSVSPTSDPIAQRIQQLRSQGVPDQTIAKHLLEKGIDPAQYGL